MHYQSDRRGRLDLEDPSWRASTTASSSAPALTASELRKKRLAGGGGGGYSNPFASSSCHPSVAAPPFSAQVPQSCSYRAPVSSGFSTPSAGPSYRPGIDSVDAPFVYDSYRGTRSIPIDDVKRKRQRRSIGAILILACVACVVGMMDDLPLPWAEDYASRSLRDGGDVEGLVRMLLDRHLQNNAKVLAILKTRWPECIDLDLTSQECKDLIDADIENMFTGVDRNITSHIIKVRSVYDENYNLVVIQTSAARGGLVGGIFRDGMVYYHFDWNSTGIEANETAQLEIPPVNGYIVDGVNVNGSTIDDFIAGNATGYIAGGWYKPYYVDTDWGQAKLEAYLATNKSVDAEANLAVPEGTRSIGPWDCAGLKGESCCAMIKHDIRDADVNGKAIQCWIEEASPNGPLTRKTCEDDITKVCVYEKYDGKVLTTPILAYDRVIDQAVRAGYNISDPSDVGGASEVV